MASHKDATYSDHDNAHWVMRSFANGSNRLIQTASRGNLRTKPHLSVRALQHADLFCSPCCSQANTAMHSTRDDVLIIAHKTARSSTSGYQNGAFQPLLTCDTYLPIRNDDENVIGPFRGSDNVNSMIYCRCKRCRTRQGNIRHKLIIRSQDVFQRMHSLHALRPCMSPPMEQTLLAARLACSRVLSLQAS